MEVVGVIEVIFGVHMVLTWQDVERGREKDFKRELLGGLKNKNVTLEREKRSFIEICQIINFLVEINVYIVIDDAFLRAVT